MSQYPSPYQSPQPFQYYTQQQQANPNAPASRAGVLTIVIGVMSILFAGCLAVAIAVVGSGSAGDIPGMPAGMDMETMRTANIVTAIAMVVGGIIYIILGSLIRKPGKGAAVTALVLSSLAMAYLLCNTVAVFATSGQPLMLLVSVLIMLVPLALLIWHIIWLVGAIKSIGMLQSWTQHYQAQMWYQHQQQQMYAQQQIPPPQNPAPPSTPA